jgi:hypothetical protein
MGFLYTLISAVKRAPPDVARYNEGFRSLRQ